MQRRVGTIRSAFFEAIGVLGMLSQRSLKSIMVGFVLAYLVLCATLLTGLRFDSNLSLDMTDNIAYQQMVKAEALLPQPNPLIVLLPCNDSRFAASSLEALSSLVAKLVAEAANAGAEGWTVRSILGESIPLAEDESIKFQELSAYSNNGEALRRAIESYPTLGNLFCPNGDAWMLYLYPFGETDGIIRTLEHLRPFYPEIIISGSSWMTYQSTKLLSRDLLVIIPLSILAIVLVFILYEKAGKRSILLTLGSVLPSIGTIALYPVFGYPLKVSTILAPLLVLALSTTYVVHVYHHSQAGKKALATFYQERGKVIFWSGITTLLGFASLILSPIDDIRTNGFFIILGMVMAFIWDLGLLPLYFSFTVSEIKPAKIVLRESQRYNGGSHQKLWRIGVVALVLLLVSGIRFLKITDLPVDSYIVSSQQFDLDIERLKEYIPLMNEVITYIDSGVEGGIVDPDFFARTKSCALALQNLPGIRSVYVYSDIIEELAKGVSYPSDALESETGIGELLELIPLDADSPRLYDLSYRTAVFKINIDADTQSLGLSINRTRAIRAVFKDYYDESMITIAGSWPRLEISIIGFAKGQVVGLVFYFIIVLVLLVIFLRLPRKSLVICTSPALAILASLGFCGYAGWGLTPTLSLALASIAGVGIDDAIIWGIYSHRPAMKRSVLGTTVLLLLGLAPLLLSYHLELIRGVIAVMIGLILSTLIVLKVLPWKEE